MKFNGKLLILGCLLSAGMSVQAETQTVSAPVQAVPVMTMDTINQLNNLRSNMRKSKLNPNYDLKRSIDDMHIMRFRGIDLSDKPLLEEAKQRAKRDQAKTETAAKKSKQGQSVNSDD